MAEKNKTFIILILTIILFYTKRIAIENKNITFDSLVLRFLPQISYKLNNSEKKNMNPKNDI